METMRMFGDAPDPADTDVEEYTAPKRQLTLRPYQDAALSKILWSMGAGLEGNELVVLPTGAGKSVVIAHLAKGIDSPILILQPTKEILEQNLDKLLRYVPDSEVGIYSASMNEKTIGRYTFATIQSIYKKPADFLHFKLVILDEAHLLNPKSLDGMFTSFLKAIGSPKVVGFTATPYRMDTGWNNLGTDTWGNRMLEAFVTIKLINRMKGLFWKRMLYCINTEELMAQGYLCPLEYIDRSVVEHEALKLNKSRSDFDLDAYEDELTNRQQQIMDAIAWGMERSKSTLVFCSSVRQAERLAGIVEGAKCVSAKTPKKERDKIVKDFKDGSLKVVFNVGVLSIGFDHPALDCIILLRPTRSIGLYYQMLGRGVRIAPGKTSCKVIDLTSTVKNMGRIETIKLIRREKWELESETGSWHNKELYRYTIKI